MSTGGLVHNGTVKGLTFARVKVPMSSFRVRLAPSAQRYKSGVSEIPDEPAFRAFLSFVSFTFEEKLTSGRRSSR
jgi:hypothetical protein